MSNSQEVVDSLLEALKSKIRERGFTQVQIQEVLKWGRSFISQLLNQRKGLRLQSVLQILDVIGVEPAEFFAELFKWPAQEGSSAQGAAAAASELELRRKLGYLQSSLEGLVRILVAKDVIAANESVAVLASLSTSSANPGGHSQIEAKVSPRRRRKATSS